MIICWFSAGVTSAVATKLTVDKYDDVSIVYFETGNHHEDNLRFLRDCEKWYGRKIEIIQNPRFKNIEDVFRHRKFINSPYGAPCTKYLKKEMRMKYEKEHYFTNQVFGFEYTKREVKRAKLFSKNYPRTNAIYPLIELELDKKDCISILADAGIELPEMYKLGYSNNNCIGCVKGSMGYWNKIRIDFPKVFEDMAKLERELGCRVLTNTYLDELEPNRGYTPKPVVEDCGIFCEERIWL